MNIQARVSSRPSTNTSWNGVCVHRQELAWMQNTNTDASDLDCFHNWNRKLCCVINSERLVSHLSCNHDLCVVIHGQKHGGTNSSSHCVWAMCGGWCVCHCTMNECMHSSWMINAIRNKMNQIVILSKRIYLTRVVRVPMSIHFVQVNYCEFVGVCVCVLTDSTKCAYLIVSIVEFSMVIWYEV